METDEGIAAPNPCSWCIRPHALQTCKVYSGKDELACAYCKRHSKGNCKAGAVEEDKPDSESAASGQRVQQLKSRVSVLEEENASLKAGIASLKAEVAAI